MANSHSPNILTFLVFSLFLTLLGSSLVGAIRVYPYKPVRPRVPVLPKRSSRVRTYPPPRSPHWDFPPFSDSPPMGGPTKSPCIPSPPSFYQPPPLVPMPSVSPVISPAMAPSPVYDIPFGPSYPFTFPPMVPAPSPVYDIPFGPSYPFTFPPMVPAPSPFSPLTPAFNQPPPSYASPPESVYYPQSTPAAEKKT